MSNPKESNTPPYELTAPDVQTDQLARQRESDMHRAMISNELAVAFGGSALATAGIEHNVRGFVAAAALGTVALIIARSGHDITRAYHTDSSSKDQA